MAGHVRAPPPFVGPVKPYARGHSSNVSMLDNAGHYRFCVLCMFAPLWFCLRFAGSLNKPRED